MAKKALKQLAPEPISRKDLARASFERALKQAVRRSTSRTQTAFDEAVPAAFCRTNICGPEHPTVKTAEASLSPFVLALARPLPSPNAVLADQTFAPVRVNLLADTQESSQKPVSASTRTHDLTLTHEDIATHLSQSTPTPVATPLFDARIMLRGPQKFTWTPLKHSVAHTDVSAHFEPKSIPDNLLHYFDLPDTETEEEEESDSLPSLDDLLRKTENEHEDGHTFVDPTPSRIPAFLFLQHGWQRAIGVFVLLSFIVVLPLHAMQVVNQLRDTKASAESNSLSALEQLKAAAGGNLVTDPLSASARFDQANAGFSQATKQIADLGAGVNLMLSALTPAQKTLKTNRALLTIGSQLSLAGARLSEGFQALKEDPNPTPSSRIQLLQLYIGAASPSLQEAVRAMKDVDESALPNEQRDTYAQLASTLPALAQSSQEFLALSDTLLTILGTKETKHYLLVFQNNAEARPTGGFMGSFAEMTVHNGVMEQLSIPGGGTYDLQGQQRNTYVSPWPLQLLSAKWEFQDANWFPDFPTSARQIMTFYKNARGTTVDGVIAINATLVQSLISLLGPVDMPDYGRVIDADNFLSETQKIVEHEYDREVNQPKAFIGDLAPKLLDRATEGSPELFLTLADELNRGLSQKDIQLYFSNDQAQKTILAHGWGGEVKQAEKDSLMVVNTNLGGGKTDTEIKEHVEVKVEIREDGRVQNTVTISRTHLGDPQNPFAGVNNVNYQRLYVPKGSTLIHAEGFQIPASTLFDTPDSSWIVDEDLRFADASFSIDQESGTQIYNESGKTVFGNWTQTKPGTTTTSTFVYLLPFTYQSLMSSPTLTQQVLGWAGWKPTDTYSLFVQKQSGVLDRTTDVHIHLPASLTSLWSSADLSQPIRLLNDHDTLVSTLLEPSL